jgi:hypothetical protein
MNDVREDLDDGDKFVVAIITDPARWGTKYEVWQAIGSRWEFLRPLPPLIRKYEGMRSSLEKLRREGQTYAEAFGAGVAQERR